MNKAGAKISNKNIVNVIISNDKTKKRHQRRKRSNAVDLTHDSRFSNYDNLQTEILRSNLKNAELSSPLINRENPNEVHFIRNGNAVEDVNVESQWDDINSNSNLSTPTSESKKETNKKIRVKLTKGRPIKGVKYEIPSQEVLSEEARKKQRDNYQSKVQAVKYANDMNDKLISGEISPTKKPNILKIANLNHYKKNAEEWAQQEGLNNNIRTFSNY